MNPNTLNNDFDKGTIFVNGRISNSQQGYYLSGLPDQNFQRVSLDPGTELMDGRFEIKEEIGIGKFCIVYQTYDKKLQNTVALKIGVFSPVGNSVIEPLLINEHKVNSFVKDKRHVLEIYEVNRCMYEGALLILLSMEYADGGSLRDWLKNNEYDPGVRQAQGYAFFRQICLGLASLHQNNICHLDLKPENILFVKGVIKIADFGISSLKYSAMHGCGDGVMDLLHQMGTARYMSPEQFIAPHIMSIDFRSDIYSLTVILFEMSHPECKTPFEGNDQFQRFQHVQTPAPEIETINDTARRIIYKGLQKKPHDRYQTIIELIQDFDGRLQPQQENVSQEHDESCEENDSPQNGNQVISQLWDETLAKIHEPDFDAAILICRRIVGLDPNYAKALAALRELESRFEKARQFYAAIQNGMDTESLDHLVELLVEAVNIYPKHPDGHLVQMQLASRSRQFTEKMERRIELTRRDRQQRMANVNRTHTPNTNNSHTTSTLRYTGSSAYPFRPIAKRWYHRLWDFTKDVFSG